MQKGTILADFEFQKLNRSVDVGIRHSQKLNFVSQRTVAYTQSPRRYITLYREYNSEKKRKHIPLFNRYQYILHDEIGYIRIIQTRLPTKKLEQIRKLQKKKKPKERR